jgi:phage terminase small subunit
MLTGRQRKFVDAYLGRANGNATEAARIAGYGSPSEAGYATLRNTQVRAAIDAALAEGAMTAKETLWRLTRIARGDIGDFSASTPKARPRST